MENKLFLPIQFLKVSTDIVPKTSFQFDFSLPSIIHFLIPRSHHLHHSQAWNLVHFHTLCCETSPCWLSFYLLNISLHSALTLHMSFCGPHNLTTIEGATLIPSLSSLHAERCHTQHAILPLLCVSRPAPNTSPYLSYIILHNFSFCFTLMPHPLGLFEMSLLGVSIALSYFQITALIFI